MPERTARELADLYTRSLDTQDWETFETIIHPDYYVDFPQSGERIRGYANVRAMFERYPGGIEGGRGKPTVIGGEDRWAVAPNFSMIRVTGTPDVFTTITRATYPDGSKWFVIAFVRAEEGRMKSAVNYFAPDFPAPEWRAPIREPIPGWEQGG